MFPNAFRIVSRRLFAPVDIASLALFRILFGILMLWHIVDEWKGITAWYIKPAFHFKYYGFEWVDPWPGAGMYFHFVLLALAALCLTLGLWYRLAGVLLCLGFVYVFLLERIDYLNHEYLICLLCFLMIFLPAHRAASLDVLDRPRLRTDHVPAWTLWLLRAQIGIPYFYGGIAKLERDWLSGMPVRMGLQDRTGLPLIGSYLGQEETVWLIVYGGLIFDLAVVPLLLWRRTRLAAFGLAVLFHLSNAMLFNIGIFPWLMIAATTLFFEPDWPRRFGRWLTGESRRAEVPPSESEPDQTFDRATVELANSEEARLGKPTLGATRQRIIIVLLAGYLGIQFLVPLRHFLYPGNASWTEEGHRFAWRMMLVYKKGIVRFDAFDPATGERWPVEPGSLLTDWQRQRFTHDPDTILQLAHHLGHELRKGVGKEYEIRATALVSLNGRKPQLLIDPEVDLSAQSRTLRPKPWVLPLTEPLRESPWDRPRAEWFDPSADVTGEQAELSPKRSR